MDFQFCEKSCSTDVCIISGIRPQPPPQIQRTPHARMAFPPPPQIPASFAPVVSTVAMSQGIQVPAPHYRYITTQNNAKNLKTLLL